MRTYAVCQEVATLFVEAAHAGREASKLRDVWTRARGQEAVPGRRSRVQGPGNPPCRIGWGMLFAAVMAGASGVAARADLSSGVGVSQSVTENWWDGHGYAYPPSGTTTVNPGLLDQASIAVSTTHHTAATAFSAASLTEGSLRVVASTAAPIVRDIGLPGLHYAYASAEARLLDVITVVGDFSVPAFATLRVHLEGALHITQSTLFDHRFDPPLEVTAPYAGMSFYLFATGAGETHFDASIQDVAGTHWIDETFEVPVPLQFPHSHVLLSPDAPGTRSFLISSYVNGTAADSGWVDIGNTARFELELPPGYSFTSQQGFLSEAPGAEVPEPAWTGTVAAGVVALGAALNRRRCCLRFRR